MQELLILRNAEAEKDPILVWWIAQVTVIMQLRKVGSLEAAGVSDAKWLSVPLTTSKVLFVWDHNYTRILDELSEESSYSGQKHCGVFQMKCMLKKICKSCSSNNTPE